MTKRPAKPPREKSGPRQYHSPLRADQVKRTRELLLEVAARRLAEGGTEALSLREVAKEAQVSAPTAYRYFPSHEALLDALRLCILQRVGLRRSPDSLEEAASLVGMLYRGFDAQEPLVRAQLNAVAGTKRRPGAPERARKAREIVERDLPALDETSRRNMAALVLLLIDARTWAFLKDEWQLTGAEAGDLCGWAIRVLVREVENNSKSMPHVPKGT